MFILDGFQCFDDLIQQLEHTEKNYGHHFLDLLLLICFLTIQETLSMIYLFLRILYEDHNTINQHF